MILILLLGNIFNNKLVGQSIRVFIFDLSLSPTSNITVT